MYSNFVLCDQKFDLDKWDPALDSFTAKADVDSVYYGTETMTKMNNMTGDNCMWSVNSLLSHTYSSTGSRWCIDCRDLNNHPILLRGLKAGTIGYDRLPNNHIFDCNLKAVPGHRMAIYITLTGVGSVRKTNYLCHEELAIVNAALNLGAITLRDQNPEILHRDDPARFPKFETKVKGKFRRYIKARTHTFGPETMKVFATKFDEALDGILKQSDEDIETVMTPEYHGMRHDLSGLCPKKYRLAIATFKRGYHYTASLAGIKGVFKENPRFIKEFGSHNMDEWENFVMSSSSEGYDYLKDKMFQNAVLTENDIYHFDLGLEVTPTYQNKKSYMVNMKYAEKRLKEIFLDTRLRCAFAEETPMDATEIDPAETSTQTLETTMLDEVDQNIFDLGNPLATEEIMDEEVDDDDNLYNRDILPDDDSEYFPDDEYDRERNEITSRDLFFDSRKLGVNTYEKYLSKGNVGGVHSGQALLRFKEHAVDLEDINVEREILSSRTKMEVCGGQVYDPGTMADALTKQRQNLDDFAALPNLMSRLLSSNRGSIDDDTKEMYLEFVELTMHLSWFIEDCANASKKSCLHSTRFEFFFVSTLKSDSSDINFPRIDLAKFIYTSPHEMMSTSMTKELRDNLKPIKALSLSIKDLMGEHMHLTPNPERLHPAVKTKLVFCSEVLVSLLETTGFQGRITKCLERELATVTPQEHFFNVPVHYEVPLGVNDKSIGDMSIGLLPRLLQLPKVRHHNFGLNFVNRLYITDFDIGNRVHITDLLILLSSFFANN